MSIASRDSGGEDRGSRVPTTAAWLGGMGLVPFVAPALAAPFAAGDLKLALIRALLAYGAAILSFLGGIHWGAGMTRPIGRADRAVDAGTLAISVVPSLAGWVALLLDPRSGLILLALAFAANLLLDIRATRSGLMPPWYPKLRKPLTAVVVAALIVQLGL